MKNILQMGGVFSFLIVGGTAAIIANAGGLSDSIEVDEKTQIILKDKSEHYYTISPSGHVKRGVSDWSYYISPLRNENVMHLGGGSADAVNGGCGVGVRKESLALKKGVVNLDLQVKKINKDGWFDIFLEYTEEDCKTGKRTTITNIFYATENGFSKVEGR